MNIQIFGKKKCFNTKKAERYFKERAIKYQFVDLLDKGISKGEFENIKKAVGGLGYMLDENCKDKKLMTLFNYLSEEDKEDKMLENPILLKTPIVRNGKQATVGVHVEIWKDWE
jgi:arsenate reductase-like glutaredoxin family protein